eukprot:CAMPEP_0119262760 /NCGR_PEP_ID=MMETSP1329-20130426/2387_1 /TAXON_ID=114041 /ORGANISM="Genus nov. species nov., Strain RCC1024" /LENGTH=189 /DNA_ID=CAMNT_0007262435 /DNA_START=162 /DNA_END=729 /DNA_ORIENTATION=-
MARLLIAVSAAVCASAYVPASTARRRPGACGDGVFFDDVFGGGEKKDDSWKDEQMAEQQRILKLRQDPKARNQYFDKVDKKRMDLQQQQVTKWGFQKDQSADPLVRWKELRESGEIGNLKTGLGTDGEKREGGIQIPFPSFGVGGSAGVGGEYDNGERFDLRLPYVDQGYEDPDADVMGKLMGMFGGKK